MSQYDGSFKIDTTFLTKNAVAQLGRLENQILKSADKVDSLRSKMDLSKNVQIPTKEYKEITSDISKAEQELEKLTEKQAQMQQEGKNSGAAWDRINQKIQATKEYIEYANGELQELINTGKAYTIGNPEESAKIGQQLQYEEGNLASLIQKEDLLNAKIRAQAEEEQRLAQIKENATIADQELVDLLERRKQLLKEISDLEKAGVTEGYQEYDNALGDLSDIQEQINAIRQLREGATDVQSSYTRLGDAMKQTFKTIARGFIDIPISATKTGIKGLISAFQKLGSVAKNVAVSSFRMLGTAAKAALSKVGSLVGSVIAKVRNLGTTAKQSFFTMNAFARKSSGPLGTMVSRFKGIAASLLLFNWISKAFNGVVQAIKDGFGNLYKDNEKFKNSVDELKASVLTLKNAFAAAFRPLVDIAIPYIQKASDYMIGLLDKVGQFMAAITGQETYTKAIRQTVDAFKDAEKAAEGYLSPLDEINKFSTNEDKDKADQTGVMFEEVPISDKFKNLAKRLRDMWEKSNFSDLGKTLGEKLKNALDNIPWEGIKENASKIGKSIASLINGFVEVDGLANSIGRTFAEAVNTAFEFLNAFVHELHWASVGKFIADSISGFFNNIDWTLIYDTFVTGAKGLGNAINSFVDNFDWNVISTTISNFVNTYVDTWYIFITMVDWAGLGMRIGEQITATFAKINFTNAGMMVGERIRAMLTLILNILQIIKWEMIGQKVADFINGIDWNGVSQTLFGCLVTAFSAAVDMIYNFVSNIDWVELGTTLGANLNNAFHSIDWAKAGEALSEVFKSFFDFITAAIEAIDWWQVGEDVKTFLVNIDWVGVVEALGHALGVAFGALAGIIGGLIGDTVEGAKAYFQSKIEECGGNVVLGILKGIADGIVGIAEWIYEHIFQPFIDGFKSAFGIHSPSTVMQELGVFIIQGLLNGIKSLVDSVKQTWTSMKETAVKIWQDVGKNTANSVNNMRSSISNTMSSIKGSWDSAWGNMGSKVSNVLSSVKNALSSAVDWISSKVQSIKNKLDDLWDKASETFSSSGGSGRSYSMGTGISSYSMRSMATPYAINPTLAALNDIDPPGYATGQVIPRTMKKHLAYLGDNPTETEVVSPLSTMKEALKEAMIEMGGVGSNQPIIAKLYLDGKQVYETVIKQGKVQQMSSGNNDFLLGTT